MTDTQSALLAAILSDPADDTARLVYADWLDENGHQERAAFIRVQVELARDPRTENVRTGNYDARDGISDEWQRTFDLVARERELWGYEPRPLPDGIMHGFLRSLPNGWAALLDSDNGSGLTHDYPWAHVSRGFVSRITCTSADWLRHADSLYWRRGQTVECPECRGYGGEDKYLPDDPGNNLMHGPHWYPCRSELCNKGLVPRPMPPGAQPLERVIWTELAPEMNDDWFISRRARVSHRNGKAEWEFDTWPGIVFEVRPAQEPQTMLDAVRDRIVRAGILPPDRIHSTDDR